MFFYYHHRTHEDFLKDFIDILKNGTDFDEYNFECPPTSPKTYEDNSNPFEFILMKTESKLMVKSIVLKSHRLILILK